MENHTTITSAENSFLYASLFSEGHINVTALLTILESLSSSERESLFSEMGISNKEELYLLISHADGSNQKTGDLMEHYEYRLHKALRLYVPPLLLIIGTIGNILSFCVLIRKAMRRTSTYNYLAVLSLTDMLVLYIGLLRLWIGELTGVDIRNEYEWSCKLISTAGYTVSDYSVWLLIAVTVERYIVTVHSLKASSLCTRERAVKTIIMILLILISINLHFLWTTQLRVQDGKADCKWALGYEHLIEKVWPWVDAFLYCILPFVIIMILNCLIVQKVISSRRHRQFLSARARGSPSVLNSRSSSSESGVKMTIMLLSISFTFLFCTLPMNVTLINAAFWQNDTTSDKQISRLRLTHTISELLMYTNHSINFYLYLLTGQKFRQQLVSMLFPCKKKEYCNNYSVVTQENCCNLQNGSLPSPKEYPDETEMVVMNNGSFTKDTDDTDPSN